MLCNIFSELKELYIYAVFLIPAHFFLELGFACLPWMVLLSCYTIYASLCPQYAHANPETHAHILSKLVMFQVN